VLAGAVGFKAEPHVLRAAIHMREELMGAVVETVEVGLTHAMLVARIECEPDTLTHGDAEAETLLAEFKPMNSQSTHGSEKVKQS